MTSLEQLGNHMPGQLALTLGIFFARAWQPPC